MQGYNKTTISMEEIVPLAQKMRQEGRRLVMIHGHLDAEGAPIVTYEYEIGPDIEVYEITGEQTLPSIAEIYDQAAAWPERELNELMGLEFTGLDTSERLFLPDNMLSGQGQIIVTPMAELVENRFKKKEE